MRISQKWQAIKRVGLSHPWGARLKIFLDNHRNPVTINKKCTLSPRLISMGRSNSILIGEGSDSVRNLTVEFRGNKNSVEIGDHVIFGKDCRFVLGANNGRIVIGGKSFIGDRTIFVVQEDNMSIMIGNEYLGSSGVCIRTSDEHLIMDDNGQRTNPPSDVIIGNHVWLARDVEVLKGVTIGDNCVLGSGAKVTKNIPPNSIAVGIPAKVIKNGVYWKH